MDETKENILNLPHTFSKEKVWGKLLKVEG